MIDERIVFQGEHVVVVKDRSRQYAVFTCANDRLGYIVPNSCDYGYRFYPTDGGDSDLGGWSISQLTEIIKFVKMLENPNALSDRDKNSPVINRV